MSRFNDVSSGGRGRGKAMGGHGMRLRDGSCQGAGRGTGPCQAGAGFSNGRRTGANSSDRSSASSVAEALLSAIRERRQQLGNLGNTGR